MSQPTQDKKQHQDDQDSDEQAPGLWQIVSSVFAAAFGVQSKKNRERDFQHGKPVVFIIAGIVGTVVFIATVYAIVSTVLSQAGA